MSDCNVPISCGAHPQCWHGWCGLEIWETRNKLNAQVAVNTKRPSAMPGRVCRCCWLRPRTQVLPFPRLVPPLRHSPW